MNRMRVVITTTSDWSRLTIVGSDKIINHKGGLISGAANSVVVDEQEIFIGGKTLGATATLQYDMLLPTDGLSARTWRITKGWGQRTHVEIYNLNDYAHPVLVASIDDTEPRGDAVTFNVGLSLESSSGPLSSGNLGPKRVFATYYPWYTRDSWQLWPLSIRIDKPSAPYDTGSQADVSQVINNASVNGIDGFFASWQGTDGLGTNINARFSTLLNEAALRQNFSVAAYLETRVANAVHSSDCLPDAACQPDPAYLEQWITYVVQNYGSSPAYLKMDKKLPDGQIHQVPVIAIYWAGDSGRNAGQNGDLTKEQWAQIFANLHNQGIDAYYIADSIDTSYLSVFDGLHSYNPSVFSNLSYFASTRASDTKTYSLLTDPDAQRKLWMGTVVPGMDTTKLTSPGAVVQRGSGATYSSMWDTFLAGSPDWVMVTSWNEYNENTHIENSMLYGNTYLDLTRSYSDLFKGSGGGDLFVSGVSASAFLPAGFEVTWQTNRAADAELFYGKFSGSYTGHVSASAGSDTHRLVASGLQPGTYYAKVRSTDPGGSVSMGPEFQVVIPGEVAPQLTVQQERTYWSDYASYLERQLSVDFRIANTGQGAANSLLITGISTSEGAASSVVLPLALGNIPSGSSGLLSMKWSVSQTVGTFNVRLWAQALTAQGTKVYYPGPPMDQS